VEEGYIDENIYSNTSGPGKRSGDYYGYTLFGDDIKEYHDKSAFTSGILLFNNCEKIKFLFKETVYLFLTSTIRFHLNDQPYLVYNAFKHKLYDNKLLKEFCINKDHKNESMKSIHHFPVTPGDYKSKFDLMKKIFDKAKLKYLYPRLNLLIDVYKKPKKNTSFPIVALCVSYNYFDTLKFMLPVNYLHFYKIYILTQSDDTNTINFCKQFDNVEILLYNFKNNNKVFDKYGAMRYAQTIMYKEYPDCWYVNIDSDIILPNNLIDILISEKLNPDCIYGASRIVLHKSYELLYKNENLNNLENIKLLNKYRDLTIIE